MTNWINYFINMLGGDYQKRRIDGEMCIYRDYGDDYTLEISNMNNRKTSPEFNLYIWADSHCNNPKVVLSIMDCIPKHLKKWLDFAEKFVKHHKANMPNNRTHMRICLSQEAWSLTEVDSLTYELYLRTLKSLLHKQPWSTNDTVN